MRIKRLRTSVSQRRVPWGTERSPLTMIDEKPTDGTSASKTKLDGHGMMKSEIFERLKKQAKQTFLAKIGLVNYGLAKV